VSKFFVKSDNYPDTHTSEGGMCGLFLFGVKGKDYLLPFSIYVVKDFGSSLPLRQVQVVEQA
jgi:hypothetical protein